MTWQACFTFPSCLASSSSPTFARMIFCSVVIVPPRRLSDHVSTSAFYVIPSSTLCDPVEHVVRSQQAPYLVASSSNGVFRACPTEDVAKTVVALMARVLEDLLGIVFGERHR